MKMASMMDWTPMVTVNLGTGTPEEACIPRGGMGLRCCPPSADRPTTAHPLGDGVLHVFLINRDIKETAEIEIDPAGKAHIGHTR